MMRGCKFSFHVSIEIAAIAYIYFSTVLVFIDQWFGLATSPGMLNAVIFTFLAVMCLFSYRIAIFTNPGRVPSSFMPDVEDSENPIHEIKDGNLRYCQKCSLYKPPRAHHCRICNRCVLRMDHHCVWMNNCVGHANYNQGTLHLLDFGFGTSAIDSGSKYPLLDLAKSKSYRFWPSLESEV